jgi:tetratricopeptide (TPR) repeat protein
MQGKTVAAETEYRRAVEINAADARAPVFGGLLLGAAGGQAEAMHIVEDVLSRNPDDGMALAARFELELAADRRNEALATAQRLVEVGAGDTDTLIRAGKLARDAGRLDLATALFGLADQRSPGDPDVLGHLGTAQLAVGDLSGAERALSTVRALRPRDPRAPFYLGNIALLRNDETSARRHFDESLALDPKFTAPLLNLARWLIERRRPDEAVALVEDALRRRPGEPEAQQLRAKLSSAR